MPPLLVQHITHILLRHVLGEAPTAMQARVAEMLMHTQKITVLEDGGLQQRQLNATDADGDPLSFSAVGSLPAGVVVNANGSFSFDPSLPVYQAIAAGQTQTVSFQYLASDGLLDAVAKTVTITVVGANDAPTVAGKLYATPGAENIYRISALAADLNSGIDAVAASAVRMTLALAAHGLLLAAGWPAARAWSEG